MEEMKGQFNRFIIYLCLFGIRRFTLCWACSLRIVSSSVKVKGKDVNLYSASTYLQDSSNAHFVTETEPPGRI